jgi:hypothetical protein
MRCVGYRKTCRTVVFSTFSSNRRYDLFVTSLQDDSTDSSNLMCWFSGMLAKHRLRCDALIPGQHATTKCEIYSPKVTCYSDCFHFEIHFESFKVRSCMSPWMRCVGFLDANIFCNNFARWLQKILATCDAIRPRNPRFKDVHTGTKRRLDVKTSNRDSGISGSGCNVIGFPGCYYLL